MLSFHKAKRIFQIFSMLFGLFYSTIIISYFKWGTEIEEPTIRESVTYFVYIMYALFGYLLYYFIWDEGSGGPNMKDKFLHILKLIIMFLIIGVFLYLGGLLCYVDNKLYTTDADTPWIYASIALWSIFLLLILLYILSKFGII